MVGESHLKEQGKTQWERLDVEGCNLINGILTAKMEEVEWPANTEPYFLKREQQKPSEPLMTPKRESTSTTTPVP